MTDLAQALEDIKMSPKNKCKHWRSLQLSRIMSWRRLCKRSRALKGSFNRYIARSNSFRLIIPIRTRRSVTRKQSLASQIQIKNFKEREMSGECNLLRQVKTWQVKMDHQKKENQKIQCKKSQCNPKKKKMDHQGRQTRKNKQNLTQEKNQRNQRKSATAKIIHKFN